MLTEGENEGGLEAVALTIGDENVKGTEGGVDAVSGSWEEAQQPKPGLDFFFPLDCPSNWELICTLSARVSVAGVTGATLGKAVLWGGRGEVKSNVGKGRAPLGSERSGRSGTSATCRE